PVHSLVLRMIMDELGLIRKLGFIDEETIRRIFHGTPISESPFRLLSKKLPEGTSGVFMIKARRCPFSVEWDNPGVELQSKPVSDFDRPGDFVRLPGIGRSFEFFSSQSELRHLREIERKNRVGRMPFPVHAPIDRCEAVITKVLERPLDCVLGRKTPFLVEGRVYLITVAEAGDLGLWCAWHGVVQKQHRQDRSKSRGLHPRMHLETSLAGENITNASDKEV